MNLPKDLVLNHHSAEYERAYKADRATAQPWEKRKHQSSLDEANLPRHQNIISGKISSLAGVDMKAGHLKESLA